MQPPEQLELYKVDLRFVKILNDLIHQGKVAEMGAKAFTALVCIRAHCPMGGTSAFPSVATISRTSGIGKTTLYKCLDRLEALGFIRKRRDGRKNNYELMEHIYLHSTDPDERDDAVAVVPFGAVATRKYMADVQEFTRSGALPPGSPVVIKNLNLTINIAQDGSNAVFINALEALNEVPAGPFREIAERMMQHLPRTIEDALNKDK